MAVNLCDSAHFKDLIIRPFVAFEEATKDQSKESQSSGINVITKLLYRGMNFSTPSISALN